MLWLAEKEARENEEIEDDWDCYVILAVNNQPVDIAERHKI